MSNQQIKSSIKAINQRWLLWLSLVAVLMFGFGYALVPLYNLLCQVTGLNGKTGGPVAASTDQNIDYTRKITVQFLTTNNAELPWKFYTKLSSIEVHPGENKQVSFFAENDSNHQMTVQAVPSVTPGLAANYLRKTECFCFEQQTLASHEKVDMPLIFHLDKDIPKEYHTITLAYTLFDAGKFIKKKT